MVKKGAMKTFSLMSVGKSNKSSAIDGEEVSRKESNYAMMSIKLKGIQHGGINSTDRLSHLLYARRVC
jgi:hypothetical protein